MGAWPPGPLRCASANALKVTKSFANVHFSQKHIISHPSTDSRGDIGTLTFLSSSEVTRGQNVFVYYNLWCNQPRALKQAPLRLSCQKLSFNLWHDLVVTFGDLGSNRVKGCPLEVKPRAWRHYDVQNEESPSLCLFYCASFKTQKDLMVWELCLSCLGIAM